MTINGRLESTHAGRDLLVTRHLPIAVDDAWRWVTESKLTSTWYGPWTGEARVGGIVDVTMNAEEGAPTSGFRIDECRAPGADGTGRLELASTGEPPFNWVTAIELAAVDGGATVTLRHVSIPTDIPLGDLGAGWEFYLDALVAAVEGRPGKGFDEVLDEVRDDYEALARVQSSPVLAQRGQGRRVTTCAGLDAVVQQPIVTGVSLSRATFGSSDSHCMVAAACGFHSSAMRAGSWTISAVPLP